MLIDSHCHLDHSRFDADRDGVIARARAAGLTHIVTVGTDIASSERALGLARQHDDIFATAGVHPHDAKGAPVDYLSQLRLLAADPRVKAVGEIGLDYHYDFSPREVQRRLFAEQLELAKELTLPVVIHLREADADGFEILKAVGISDAGGVLHCFMGPAALARRALDLGLCISVPGVITFPKATELAEAARGIPLDALLIETDAPFLAPVPHRGERNEPAFLPATAARLAEVTGNSLADVLRTTGAAAARLFGLPSTVDATRPCVAYPIRDNLYLNITNDCTLTCRFCPKRRDRFTVKGHSLRLERAPSVEEIKAACADLTPYREVVFVGLGEPTLRLDVVKEIAAWLKGFGKRIRLDTDGLASLVHGRPVARELAEDIDAVSVSLNAADDETYARLCPSRFGPSAHAAVQDFIAEARDAGLDTTATVVAVPELDADHLERCRVLVERELGVRFRVRRYDDVG